MYYSFGVSWGVHGTVDNRDDVPGDLSEDELYEEPEIATGVKLYLSRSEHSGQYLWRLVASESEIRCDGRGESYPNGYLPDVVPLSEPSSAVRVNFGLALERLGISQEPGWFFHWSVS